MASPQTIQPSTIDTYLREASPTSNSGTATSFTVSPTTASRTRSILKFDFSAVVPAGAVITLATLNLYCQSVLASRTITVYRLLRTDWVEAQATWNIFKTGSNWGTAGALNTTTDITTTDAATSASLSAAGWQAWTVTAQVQTALNGVAGVAHFLVADVGATATGNNAYRTREWVTDTTQRAKLYIEYTLPILLPHVNIGGTWKSPVSMMVNIGGTWKAVVSVKVNIGGTWKDLA